MFKAPFWKRKKVKLRSNHVHMTSANTAEQSRLAPLCVLKVNDYS